MYSNSNDKIRKMINAGTNYPKIKEELISVIQILLSSSKIELNEIENLKGLILPLSNFSESGLTSSWAFNYLNNSQEKITYFIFIPITNINISEIAISECEYFETPLGNVKVNQELIKQIKEKNPEILNADIDYEESEESIENNLMFLKFLKEDNFDIVPIYVGNLSLSKIDSYSKLFSKYIKHFNINFIICSDLLYWGNKYNYTNYDNKKLEIFENIEIIDKNILKFIENFDYNTLLDYIEKHSINLLGKYCLLLFIKIIKNLDIKFELKFLRYSQNYNVTKLNENSKSFASGIFYLKN